MSEPQLFHFRVSHYNEKVRWALDHKGWAHRRTALVPGFHIARVRTMTGQNKVPVIRIDDRVLNGSSAILEEIEKQRPDRPLYPADAEARARAMKLQSYFDDEVAPAVRRLVWSIYLDRPSDCSRMATAGFGAFSYGVFRAGFALLRPAFLRNMQITPATVAEARARLGGYFDRIESEIGPSGYLVGDQFGVADLCVAAVMTAIVRPPQFPYPWPEPWPPGIVELRESVAQRRGFQWVLDMYARHRGTSAELV